MNRFTAEEPKTLQANPSQRSLRTQSSREKLSLITVFRTHSYDVVMDNYQRKMHREHEDLVLLNLSPKNQGVESNEYFQHKKQQALQK
jgi:hypothetical protein